MSLTSISGGTVWTVTYDSKFGYKVLIPISDLTYGGESIDPETTFLSADFGEGYTSVIQQNIVDLSEFEAVFNLTADPVNRQLTVTYDNGAGGTGSVSANLTYTPPPVLISASSKTTWTITPVSSSGFNLTIPISDLQISGVSITNAHAIGFSRESGLNEPAFAPVLDYSGVNIVSQNALGLIDSTDRSASFILSWNGTVGTFTIQVPPYDNSGNGGNNGGTGHNNMSAELKFQCLFEASATGSYDITVLGEGAQAVTVDETIVVNVPLTDMRKLLVFESTWAEYSLGSTGFSATDNGTQPVPNVQLQLDHIIGPVLDNLSCALTGAEGAAGYSTSTKFITDDAGTSTRKSLPYYFTTNSSEFLFGAVTGGALMSIPQEAIKQIENKGIEGSLLSDVFSHHDTTEETFRPALLNLFEQAVAASKVTVGTTGETGPNADNAGAGLNEADLTGGASSWASIADLKPAYGVQFAVDDTLSMYVKYSMVKERTYKVDSDITSATFTGSSGSTGSELTLSYGGVTFSLATDGSETSEPVTKVYEIKLKCTDSTPSQWA